MSDDRSIVERIRDRVEVFHPGGDTERLLLKAANVIEYLSATVEMLERRIDQLIGEENDGVGQD